MAKEGYCAHCSHAEFAHRGSNPDPSGQKRETSCDICLCKAYYPHPKS